MMRTVAAITALMLLLLSTAAGEDDRPSLRQVGFGLYREGKYLEAEAVLMAAYQFDLPRLQNAADPTAPKTERALRLGRAMCYDRMKLWNSALQLYLDISPDGRGRLHKLKPISKIEHRVAQMYQQSGQIEVLRELLDRFDSEHTRAFKATPPDARPYPSEAALVEALPYRLLRKIASDTPVPQSEKTKAFLASMAAVPKSTRLPTVPWTHPDVSIRIQLDSGYVGLPYEVVKNYFIDKAIDGEADNYKWYTEVLSALRQAKDEDPTATAVNIVSKQEVTHYMVPLLISPHVVYYSNKTKAEYGFKELKHIHEKDDMMKRHTLVAPSGEQLKFYFPRSEITAVRE